MMVWISVAKETRISQELKNPPNHEEDCNHSFQPNGMPNFKQCDPRWKCYPYAGHPGLSSCTDSYCNEDHMNNNICVSGCGITTSAMILNFYGFTELNPTGMYQQPPRI